ncbi:crotonase/enoyl-CoA hydratase family protein [Desulfoluna butyratoxydans]|uniref:Crotonase superfamily n=1 Tax=Desulfoluna butyratoxydans TaxID=231438 RepID=A0A4U8YNB8_9BACT|nr:crotonase/enoyl-CoA hydratase family protein [Desulfoluna butyratoxydans]VFQ45300.1 crotonase superfamily [Desulfoluna butyratoxydans]
MNGFTDICVEQSGRVVTATLNRPESRNAITGETMVEDLCRLVDEVNKDPGISVLVLTGSDPAFSSGGNIKDMAGKKGMFAGEGPELVARYKNHVQRIPLAMETLEIPVIAAVNGPAVGAGFDLTLMCDLRIASERATFGETFLNVGLIPGDGGAWLLPRVLGMAKACELAFTAEVIDAQRALEMEVVSRVVPHGALMKEAAALAETIAAKPPRALRMTKRLLKMGRNTELPDFLETCALMQAQCHGSEDHKEALAAMFEKREPRFTGK